MKKKATKKQSAEEKKFGEPFNKVPVAVVQLAAATKIYSYILNEFHN